MPEYVFGYVLKDISMSNSPVVAAETAKPVAPGTTNPVKPAPQHNQDNKQAETKPGEQQK
jgi:hypothetical protein